MLYLSLVLIMESKDDPRFRITPVQQMAAACSGALITSIIGKEKRDI